MNQYNLKLFVIGVLCSAFAFGHNDNQDLSEGEWTQELFGNYGMQTKASCTKASSAQLSEVNKGNLLKDTFLAECAEATDDSAWCQQIIRPNPSSISTFRCTYGANQPHQLIHPTRSTWKNAIQAVNLIQDLEDLGIEVCQIYNWWRPAPYNANVGGAAGRHPFGTSVDVRFCSLTDMERGHKQLCKWRNQGLLRALGYYGSTGLHFGIGDKTANTWGKNCP